MNAVIPMRDLVDKLCARGEITSDDVLMLRRQVFPDGVVSAPEAEAIFKLDHACKRKAPEWARFYVDALTDYFVWQSEPRGYVSDTQGCVLIARVTHDGHIDQESELELLLNVVHWCEQCPDALGVLALKAVKESVLTPQTAAYGSNRAPALITGEDVELLRRVLYAPGSPGGFTVSRDEAELLFDLDRATAGHENAPSWPDLFAKGVANALMFPRGPRVVPSADVVLRREKWLDERPGIGDLLLNTGKSLAKGNVAFDAIFGTKEAREARAEEERRVNEALHREAIDAEEARWLVAQVAQGQGLSEGVVRLLKFIKDNAPRIDPALDPLLAKAGL